MIIVPTVSRIVWYRPNSSDLSRGPAPGDQPLAAIITHVHDDRLVDLHVFPCGGGKLGYGLEKIQLIQEGDPRPTGDARFCEWPDCLAEIEHLRALAGAVSQGQSFAEIRADAQRKMLEHHAARLKPHLLLAEHINAAYAATLRAIE